MMPCRLAQRASGALAGEAIGGYSAYRSDGNVLAGVLVGGAVGVVTGYAGSEIADAGEGGWLLLGSRAPMGGGQGIAAGFAGGRGTIESILLTSAVSSTIAISLGAAYDAVSGYKFGVTWQPGTEAIEKLESTAMPVEFKINIGYATPNPGSCWTCEGGPLSLFLNRGPGINAVSGFHDGLLVRLELGGISQTGISILNYPTMLPAAALTYGSLLPGVPADELTRR